MMQNALLFSSMQRGRGYTDPQPDIRHCIDVCCPRTEATGGALQGSKTAGV